MGNKRTPIGKFIHTSWVNINLRVGKYRDSKAKNLCYKSIYLEFNQKQYKEWCLLNEKHILSLNRPSVDRIDSSLNYTLDNIQIIELSENCKKKRLGNKYINGPKSNALRGIRKSKYNTWRARITINKKEVHIGTFKTKEQALVAFRNKYIEIWNKEPFSEEQIYA